MAGHQRESIPEDTSESSVRKNAPFIRLPQPNKETGPRTLLVGSGLPDTEVEVWDKDEKRLIGKGHIDAGAHWVFSVIEDLAEGLWEIKARHIIDGQPSSVWSDLLAFTVTAQDTPVPLIDHPTGNSPVPALVKLSGRGSESHTVHVMNVSVRDATILVTAIVENGVWQTPDLTLEPGTYKVSPVQSLNGKYSDFGELLTFEVE